MVTIRQAAAVIRVTGLSRDTRVGRVAIRAVIVIRRHEHYDDVILPLPSLPLRVLNAEEMLGHTPPYYWLAQSRH